MNTNYKWGCCPLRDQYERGGRASRRWGKGVRSISIPIVDTCPPIQEMGGGGG